MILLVAVLLGAVVAPAVTSTPAAAQATDIAAAEAEFVDRINELRRGEGLGTLTVHGELVDVARRWAEEMAAADEISHNPNLADQVAADWQKLGENVGVGATVAKLYDAFVGSPAHYRNLVDPEFTHIGVAVVVGRNGALFTTHQFMKLRPGAEAKGSTPTTSAAAVATTPPTTTTPVPTVPEEVAATAPAAPTADVAVDAPRASGRLVLVLEQLRALDVS